ncbi:MAG TPA: site-2 protease family protein [Solirubrobacteraceae bacterium]|nr:site-2 protease family protein [Solirubrobacteraceae bacterium]
MSWALTFIGIIILIVVHELGHFAVAKAVGMRVERFSLFFPPKLVGVRFGETEYMIGAIPLGGYVKIAGMAPLERVPGRASGADADAPARHAASASGPRGIVDEDDPRGYFSQPVWKRMAVIAAGPAMNVLMAFLILWGVYAFSAYKPATAHQARVAAVLPGSAAAGVLRRGDEIIAVDGHPVRLHGSSASFVSEIASHRCAGAPVEGCPAATPVRLTIERGGRSLTVSLRPRYNAKEGRMLVGFDFLAARRSESASEAMASSASEMWHVTTVTVSKIGEIFTSEKARAQLHGIVGVSAVTSEAFSYSVSAAFFILALLSLSLAIINLFPFLPLDGGHLFWALAEKVRGKAIPYWVMERASMVGVLLVVLLAAIGLSNDIHSLANGSLSIHR